MVLSSVQCLDAGGDCKVAWDGYYFLQIVGFCIGLAWLALMHSSLKKLEDMEIEPNWHCKNLETEKKE